MKNVALEVKGMLNSFTMDSSFGTIDSQAGKRSTRLYFQSQTHAQKPATLRL